MTSVQTTTINAQSTSAAQLSTPDTLAPYLNWTNSINALEFNSPSLEELTHALNRSSAILLGLRGKDVEPSDLTLAPEADADTDPDAIPLTQSLVSSCSEILLKRHCDKIIMSTALVKNRGEKQLYLAVDFLQWNDERTDSIQTSPLILYPVILFYNDHSSDDSDNFLLYVDAHAAIKNKPLVDKIGASLNLPEDELDALDPQSFLLTIAGILQPYPQFKLEKKVAINILTSDRDRPNPLSLHRFRRADDPHIHKPLVQALINGKSIDDIKTVLQLIEPGAELFNSKPQNGILFDNDFKQRMQAISSYGFGNLSCRHIAEIPEKLNLWTAAVEKIGNNSLIEECAEKADKSTALYTGLGNCMDLLDNAPSSQADYYHPDHAYANSLSTLQRAKFQWRLINSEIDALNSVFRLHTLPDTQSIRNLCEILDEHKGQKKEVIHTGYFRARKTLSSLLCNKSTVYTEVEELHLKRLIKILRLRDLFEKNSEYKLSFGKLFRGMNTDWQLLESHIVFSQKLSRFSGSEALTAHILEHWQTIGLALGEYAEQINDAARAVKRLAQLLQVKENTHLLVGELLNRVESLKPRLQQLCHRQQLIGLSDRLSPKIILDTIDTIEHTQQQYNSLTDQHEKRLFREKIDNTLVWLNDSVSREKIKVQDIELLLNKMNDC